MFILYLIIIFFRGTIEYSTDTKKAAESAKRDQENKDRYGLL